MASKYAINTIECVAKEQEKISYDASCFPNIVDKSALITR